MRLIIVPSRLAASRFPRKPLVKIRGIPLVEHCLLRAKFSRQTDKVVLASCDQEILDIAEKLGLEGVLTSSRHERATERVCEAAQILGLNDDDEVVMLQGDEPLASPDDLDNIFEALSSSGASVVNLITEFASEAEFNNPNRVKVVRDLRGKALYFSREAIPSNWKGLGYPLAYNQTGMIGFKASALFQYATLGESDLEIIESVDMNRYLSNNIDIQLHLTDSKIIGVDTPEDAEIAGIMLRDDPLFQIYGDSLL